MPSTRSAWLVCFLLPLVIAGFAALWVLASLYSERQCSFMAIVGAVDVLWVLGLAPALRPGVRAVTALLSTTALIVLANWSIIAINIGVPLGSGTIEALGKLGAHHAWTVAGIANDWRDAVWVVLALCVAGGWPLVSARRRPAPSAH
ncbi:hypothetical protein DWG18_10035 [Lysobacter sp. TY2-98]|uniref:hypothetical protein n=1 Tax=Lysobacter sp. TY2-98 TaxID=2290922 RepID=UPI000E204604|nr:hypothetical protein [Lysobacter sp. TY2-98]AXK72579.1 hypothetical protein DWG18_10035 [Lysobacter sp. TY2-98]